MIYAMVMKASVESKLSPSMEDYLEAIWNLEKVNRVARVKDIADSLRVKMPSVTAALKVLREKGLANYRKNSFISLTDTGIEIAATIVSKHRTLSRFLETILLVPYERAQDMACKMEHAIDCDTLDRMARLIDSFEEEMMGSGGMDAKKWKRLIEGKGRKPSSVCVD